MFAIFIFPVQDNADTSQVYESSVVARLQEEPGRGKPRSGRVTVLHFVEEPWYIPVGLLLLLTVSRINLLRAFE